MLSSCVRPLTYTADLALNMRQLTDSSAVGERSCFRINTGFSRGRREKNKNKYTLIQFSHPVGSHVTYFVGRKSVFFLEVLYEERPAVQL